MPRKDSKNNPGCLFSCTLYHFDLNANQFAFKDPFFISSEGANSIRRRLSSTFHASETLVLSENH